MWCWCKCWYFCYYLHLQIQFFLFSVLWGLWLYTFLILFNICRWSFPTHFNSSHFHQLLVPPISNKVHSTTSTSSGIIYISFHYQQYLYLERHAIINCIVVNWISYKQSLLSHYTMYIYLPPIVLVINNKNTFSYTGM
jgi:hypothetical protein